MQSCRVMKRSMNQTRLAVTVNGAALVMKLTVVYTRSCTIQFIIGLVGLLLWVCTKSADKVNKHQLITDKENGEALAQDEPRRRYRTS